MSLPLEIDRRVHTLPRGGAHTAVLEEAVTYRVGDSTQLERHHYVIDRRSMRNVEDGRGRSFSPENRVDQAGTYRVTLPSGTSADAQYRIWEIEPGRSFWMVRDPNEARVRQHGLSPIGLQEVWRGAPVAPYYRAELRKQGFATELTFPQLVARLASNGVDVEAPSAQWQFPGSQRDVGVVEDELRPAVEYPHQFVVVDDSPGLPDPSPHLLARITPPLPPGGRCRIS